MADLSWEWANARCAVWYWLEQHLPNEWLSRVCFTRYRVADRQKTRRDGWCLRDGRWTWSVSIRKRYCDND